MVSTIACTILTVLQYSLIDNKNGVDARCVHHSDYTTEVELLNAQLVL